MGIPTNYPGLTPEMVKLIKSRAYMLSRSYGHTAEDREDLEQDMALHLLSALSRHDPARSSLATFANRDHIQFDYRKEQSLVARLFGVTSATPFA